MKTALWYFIAVMIWALSATAQDVDEQLAVEGKITTPKRQTAKAVRSRPGAPNEIIGKRLVYHGAAVQMTKTDNVLQLFNPFAPAKYGMGESNLAYDSFSGRPIGVAVLSIDF